MKFQIQESKEKQYTLDPSTVRPLKQSQKAKIAVSDKRSLGYETMTTVSNLDSEVRFSVFSLNIAQSEIHFIKREIFRYNVKKICNPISVIYRKMNVIYYVGIFSCKKVRLK